MHNKKNKLNLFVIIQRCKQNQKFQEQQKQDMLGNKNIILEFIERVCLAWTRKLSHVWWKRMFKSSNMMFNIERLKFVTRNLIFKSLFVSNFLISNVLLCRCPFSMNKNPLTKPSSTTLPQWTWHQIIVEPSSIKIPI